MTAPSRLPARAPEPPPHRAGGAAARAPEPPPRRAGGFARALPILPIRAYQAAVSPALAPRCKYHPTCSEYAVGAIRLHGALRGSVLAAWRLLRCHPWSHGGVDYPQQQTLFRSRSPIH